MENSQLKEIMIYHLKNFSLAGVEVDESTVHGDILSDDDGYGSANSKRVYKAFIRWTIVMAGDEDKPWPEKWMEMSIAQLSNKLIPQE